MIEQKYRAYIYRILTALAPIALIYGWISAEEVAVYLALAATILGVGLAALNTPVSDDDE
jgi:hypothetical protein